MERKGKHLQFHQGLQALSAIGSSAQSFLGPIQRFKMVLDDDEQDGVFISSCMELLQALDIQHPVGDIVLSACLAHHKIHGTCITTLLAMSGYWSLAVQSLLDQGLPISVIKNIGDICLDHCMKTAHVQAIQCNISLPQPPSSIDESPISMKSYKGMEHTGGRNLSAQTLDSSVPTLDSSVPKCDSSVPKCHSSVPMCDSSANSDQNQISLNNDTQSTFTTKLAFNNARDKMSHHETDYTGCHSHLTSDVWHDQFEEVLMQDEEVHAKVNERVPTEMTSCSTKSKSAVSVLSSSNKNNSDNDVVSYATNDIDDDISWYFEGAGASVINDELDQYKTVIDKSATVSEVIISTSFADNDWNRKHPVQVAPTNLHLQKSISKSESNNRNFDSTGESTFVAVLTAGGTSSVVNYAAENGGDGDDGNDDEFDSCFDDLTVQDNKAQQSNFKMYGDEDHMTDSRKLKINSTDDDDDDEDDDDFNDCFTNDLPRDNTKSLNSSKSAHNKTDVVANDNDSASKVNNKCSVTETDIATSHDFPSSNTVSSRLINLLGHSIGYKEHSVSQKLLNNSRHFRTVESVVEEHQGQGEVSGSDGHTGASSINDIPPGLTDGLEHMLGHQTSVASINLSSSSKDLRTVENLGDLDQKKDQAKVDCSTSQEDGVKTTKHDVLRNKESLEEKLKSVLQEKLSLKRKHLHSRAVNFSRYTRTIGGPQCEEAADYADQREDWPNPKTGTESATQYNKQSPSSESATQYNKQSPEDECISDLWDLGYGLRHGSDREMRLAVQAYLSQTLPGEASGCTGIRSSFDFDRTFVCCITGPSESHSSVVNGLVLPVKEHQIHNITLQSGNSLSCLLINGDLKPSARHTGYKESIKASRIYHGNKMATDKDSEWLQQVMDILNKFQISLLMTKGQVDDNVLDMCIAHGIIVVQNVPHRALQGLANKKEIITYITETNEEIKVTGVSVRLSELGWQHKPLLRKPNLERTHYVIVSSKQQLQTALICSPIISGVMGAEVQFWKCLHMLSGAIKDNKVLEGDGAIECAFIKCLDAITSGKTKLDHQDEEDSLTWQMSASHDYVSAVTMAFKDSFMQYLVQTVQNSTDFGGNVADLMCLIDDFIKHDDDGNDNGILSLLITMANKTESNRDCLYENESSEQHGIYSNINELGMDLIHQKCDRNTYKCGTECSRERGLSSGRQTIGSVVYDPFSAKIAAWQCAWEIVKTVLQSDCILISGIDKVGSVL